MNNSKTRFDCAPIGADDEQLQQMFMFMSKKTGHTAQTMFDARYTIAEFVLKAETSDQLIRNLVIRDTKFWRWFLGVWYLNDLHIRHYVLGIVPHLDVLQYAEAQKNLFSTKHKIPNWIFS